MLLMHLHMVDCTQDMLMALRSHHSIIIIIIIMVRTSNIY